MTLRIEFPQANSTYVKRLMESSKRELLTETQSAVSTSVQGHSKAHA